MKKLIITCIVMAVMIISVVPVFADTEELSDYQETVGDVTLPYYPASIYGKEYILVYCETDGAADSIAYEYILIIFGSDSLVTLNVPYYQVANNTYPMHLKGMTGGSSYNCYSYSLDDGWVLQEDFKGEIYISSGAKLRKTTVDIYLESDLFTIAVTSNADIIIKTEPLPSTNFDFISNPVTTEDRIYNLLVMDSIAAFAYIGYRSMKRIFMYMRTFRQYRKGD